MIEFFESLKILFTSGFDVEFEVADELLSETEEEQETKCPKKSRRLC